MFRTKDITVTFAGAGCGKTTYIIDEAKKELKTILPEEIAIVSFTRKGAYEARDRLVRETRLSEERLPFCKTLSSITFAALGYKTENVFNKKWGERFNKELGFSLTLNGEDECNTSDDKFLSVFNMERHGFIPYVDAVEMAGSDGYKRFVSAYTEFKKAFNLVDYTDCLVNFVKENVVLPVRYACIDEAQDLTYLQWEVCYSAFADCEKILIAGDDYQSIYTYAGARPHVLIDLARDYKTVKLEKSYRIPRKVYDLAKGITDTIGQKMDKDYVPVKSGCDDAVSFLPSSIYAVNEIKKRSNETWLCLFRNNYFTADFTKLLKENVMPYHNDNGFCISEKGLGKIKKYENMRKRGFRSEEVSKDFMKQYNIQSFENDISECDLFQGADKYVVQGYVDTYDVEDLIAMSKKSPKILVSTIHKVKGAEADNVIVFLDCTRKVFRNKFTDLDSELRLLYVACTRARKRLFFVRSTSSYGLDDIIHTIYDYSKR